MRWRLKLDEYEYDIEYRKRERQSCSWCFISITYNTRRTWWSCKRCAQKYKIASSPWSNSSKNQWTFINRNFIRPCHIIPTYGCDTAYRGTYPLYVSRINSLHFTIRIHFAWSSLTTPTFIWRLSLMENKTYQNFIETKTKHETLEIISKRDFRKILWRTLVKHVTWFNYFRKHSENWNQWWNT